MKFWTRKKGKRSLENGSKLLEQLIIDCNGVSNPIRFFSSNQILKATNPYCPLSRDRYFTWYQGVIEDRPYAIKKFCKGGGDDELEGYNDMVLSARVSNHSGFLKLIGCCLKFRLPVLVFQNPEFGVLNKRGSVGSEDSPLLPWNVRLKIAKEVAIAITYLHTAFPRIIIHRNIKATNVLLDKNWNAKLTDFSLSVTLPEGKSWIEDKVMGTLGYVEPTYAILNLVTEYTDVYSFGIFMLVLLMGRHPVDDGYKFDILDYVWDLRERGEPVEFGDDTNDMNPGQMKMFLELALRCCHATNEDKPKMISVAKELKLIEKSLNFSDLETGSDTDESEEQEEPLATESQGAEQPLDLLTASSLNSQWNRSNRGFRILCFVFCFVFAMFIGNQLHTVTQF